MSNNESERDATETDEEAEKDIEEATRERRNGEEAEKDIEEAARER
jgi:hypothetical protein